MISLCAGELSSMRPFRRPTRMDRRKTGEDERGSVKQANRWHLPFGTTDAFAVRFPEEVELFDRKGCRLVAVTQHVNAASSTGRLADTWEPLLTFFGGVAQTLADI